MAKNIKVKGSGIARTALVVGALCVACCATPLLGIFAGSAAIAALGAYSEKLAIAAIVIGAGIVVFKLSRRKSGVVCRLDKGCGPNHNAVDDGT